jgi:hypothetical protein
MSKSFRVAVLVAALWPAAVFAQPCSLADQKAGRKELTRDLAGPVASVICVSIVDALSATHTRVSPASFPGIDAATQAVGQRDAPRRAYYELTLPPAQTFKWSSSPRHPDTVLTLTATSYQDVFSMAVYVNGRPLIGTYSSRSEQQLLLTGNDLDALGTTSLVIEVQLEAAASAGGFTLSWTSAPVREPDRDSLRTETPVLQSYANRRVLNADDYDQLIEFATCDTRNTSATNTCGQEKQQPTHALIDRLIPRDVVKSEEPAIVFVGIGGANRIVLINKRGTKDVIENGQEKTVPVYTPRYRRTLPGARWFWALFVEDDQSPFETSIDVEFKPRATVSEVDEFDPSSLVSLGMKGVANPRRTVRIGMRRIRVRNPPVAVEVAFTRQGAGYGLRQWRQVYRMRSWHVVSFGAGVFIPFITVQVENHILHEPGLPTGDIPDFAVITPTVGRRQIFAMGDVFVPSWRNMADEAVGAARFWGTVAPHAVVGIGLPGEGGQAYYAGLGWNVKWEWLGITTGALISQQSHLLKGFRAGQRLPKDTPISAIAHTQFVGTVLFGVTIDLLNLR